MGKDGTDDLDPSQPKIGERGELGPPNFLAVC
jgi:hypothetical protein